MQIWLYKLGYLYKNIQKYLFMNGYERFDIVEDHTHFIKKIEELKPYIVEFNENGIIMPKVYLFDCIVEIENQ